MAQNVPRTRVLAHSLYPVKRLHSLGLDPVELGVRTQAVYDAKHGAVLGKEEDNEFLHL